MVHNESSDPTKAEKIRYVAIMGERNNRKITYITLNNKFYWSLDPRAHARGSPNPT